MTKQSHVVAEPEKPTPELLLRRFELMDDFVEGIRKANLKAGLDQKYMGLYIEWRDDFLLKRKYQNWLKTVINPKTGKFYQYSDLIANGDIPEGDYGNALFPYRRLNSLHKIQTSDGTFLMRYERWHGLSKAGQEIAISVNDLDYWTRPSVTWDFVPRDPTVRDGPSIRVGSVRIFNNNEPGGTRVWLTPFSKEKVDEFLKYSDYSENINNGTGPSFVLIKTGVQNPIAVTYEQFVSDDFDGIWNRVRAAPPKFEDFYKDMKKAKEAAEDANHHQYG
jgi:hypothetical protein